MCTHHQFLFLTAPSEKEAEFRSARRKYGSSFAFHGSKIENWHSIIRQGLFVYSYTKYQKNGAVFGPGIYTSPVYHIACGYSFILCQQNTKTKPSKHNNDQLLMEQPIIKCIALCEVIKSDSLKKHENIWVVSNPNHICIRLLFV
uniref:Poly [ADP-ribose] polymerase n=1 Tax=Eptatretus burgeri TaxID=7764 RepID=A0A8C4QIK1_EPTBU